MYTRFLYDIFASVVTGRPNQDREISLSPAAAAPASNGSLLRPSSRFGQPSISGEDTARALRAILVRYPTLVPPQVAYFLPLPTQGRYFPRPFNTPFPGTALAEPEFSSRYLVQPDHINTISPTPPFLALHPAPGVSTLPYLNQFCSRVQTARVLHDFPQDTRQPQLTAVTRT
jgi:hypothetical protein